MGSEPSDRCSFTHLTCRASVGGSCSQVPSWHTNAHTETVHRATHKHSHRRRAHAHTYTCTHGHSATTQGLEGHEKCTQPFRAHWHTRTHAPTWGLSHTQSRTNTQAPGRTVAPHSGFCRSRGTGKVAGEGLDTAVTPPPHRRPPPQAIQSELGGGAGGWGEARGCSPLFPSPLPGAPDFPSPPAPLPAQTFPSLTSPPVPRSADLGGNPESSPHPPREGGREATPRRTKGGRGLARAPGLAGRAAGRRRPGAGAPRAGCADFCFLFPGQWEKSPGTSPQPCRSRGKKDDC